MRLHACVARRTRMLCTVLIWWILVQTRNPFLTPITAAASKTNAPQKAAKFYDPYARRVCVVTGRKVRVAGHIYTGHRARGVDKLQRAVLVFVWGTCGDNGSWIREVRGDKADVSAITVRLRVLSNVKMSVCLCVWAKVLFRWVSTRNLVHRRGVHVFKVVHLFSIIFERYISTCWNVICSEIHTNTSNHKKTQQTVRICWINAHNMTSISHRKLASAKNHTCVRVICVLCGGTMCATDHLPHSMCGEWSDTLIPEFNAHAKPGICSRTLLHRQVGGKWGDWLHIIQPVLCPESLHTHTHTQHMHSRRAQTA